MDNESKEKVVSDNSDSNSSASNNVEETNSSASSENSNSSSSTINSYDGRGGIGNTFARGMDNLAAGTNNLSNRLKNGGDRLNNYANKHQDSKLGKAAGSMGDKLNNASNKLGNLGGKLGKINKGVQAANNAKNVANDPSVAGDLVKQRAKQVAGEAVKEVGKKGIKVFGKFLIPALPVIVIILLIIVAVLIGACLILGIIGLNSNLNSNGNMAYDSTCNYEATKVVVMDGNNKEILATVSLEDYVIGVACPEIGACDGAVKNKNPEYLKMFYTAVRTYTLARGNYSSSDKTITIRAATKDQQWCDLESGCLVTKTSHLVSGYNDAYYHYTYPGDYDKSRVDGSIYLTRNFTEEDLELARQYYKETYGDLILSDEYDSQITSLNSSEITGYGSSLQDYWNAQSKLGKTYEQMVSLTGNSGVSGSGHYKNKKIYKLGSYCKSTRGSGTLVSLDNYPDVSETKEINKPITTLLSSNEIENLNNYIISSVDEAGYGTSDGVAAAATALINGLYQYDYHLPYWYGGGHSKGIFIGVDQNWGQGANFDPSWKSYNAGHNRSVYSYDCSAFVSWAIKNACKPNFSGSTSSGFMSYGSGISLIDAKPGDLMSKNGHVRVIVANLGDEGVIAAESTSGFIVHGGVQFQKYSSAGSYKIVDMEKWYSNNCNSTR